MMSNLLKIPQAGQCLIERSLGLLINEFCNSAFLNAITSRRIIDDKMQLIFGVSIGFNKAKIPIIFLFLCLVSFYFHNKIDVPDFS